MTPNIQRKSLRVELERLRARNHKRYGVRVVDGKLSFPRRARNRTEQDGTDA